MAINYAGGTNRNDLYAGLTTANSAIADIKTTLVAAGWTSSDVFEYMTITFSGQPSNNDTITLDGKVYTYKTVINNANNGEVFIGADTATSLSNLKAAVNLGAGSGTAYSSATTLNTNLSGGTLTSTTLIIQGKVAGITTPYNVAKSMANGSLSSATTISGGFKFDSAITPQLLQLRLYVYNYESTTTIFRCIASNKSETEVSNTAANGEKIDGGATLDLRVIANKYQCFIFINGVTDSATSNAFWACGVPWVPNFMTGLTVTGATNATPIQITTSAVHGLITGNSVTIRGVLGNTAANITNNTITKVDNNNFTLDAVAGNGAYTSGGVVGQVGVHVIEAIWACGTFDTGRFIRGKMTNNTKRGWSALNGSTVLNPNGIGSVKFLLPSVDDSSVATSEQLWFNNSNLVTEPFMAWGTGAGNTATINGQMWDAVIIRKSLTKDITGTFDSHNWWNLTDANSDFITGSLLHVVP